MPFPDLALCSGRTNRSQATGVPDNGSNTFLHNWDLDPSQIDEDSIVVTAVAQGSSVTAVGNPTLSADKLSLIINFTQSGSDSCLLIAEHVHSLTK